MEKALIDLRTLAFMSLAPNLLMDGGGSDNLSYVDWGHHVGQSLVGGKSVSYTHLTLPTIYSV